MTRAEIINSYKMENHPAGRKLNALTEEELARVHGGGDVAPNTTTTLCGALSTTLRKGLGKSHSLCHGDLGNSELFCLAAQRFNNPQYLETARKIAMHVLKEKNEKGHYLTGVPHHIELPGLFLGLSGIGLQLLRLADPENIPSVLIQQ